MKNENSITIKDLPTFKTTTELAIYLRDERMLPATLAKSVSWDIFSKQKKENAANNLDAVFTLDKAS